MRIILVTVVAALSVVPVASCSSQPDDGRFDVVASFYPLAEAARQVGANAVDVADLTPAGAEPHDLEPTTRVIDRIDGADLVLMMGRHFQPAIEKAADRKDDGLVVTMLDALKVPGASDDPHVWLDPVEMQRITSAIREALQLEDSEHEAQFLRGEQRYLAQLADLDGAYRTGLAHCRSRVIVTAHAAFGWLARRYGLDQHAIAGLSPEQEPDPRHLADLAKLVKADHVTTIFTEALVSPKVARTLAREVGVKTAVLDPIESITKSKARSGADYVSVMKENLRVLRAALGCS
jgi:zinc transport system substrate-binding protein